MTKKSFIVALLGALLFVSSAHANDTSTALGTCMIDSLNGKERKQLAKWIFLAMSVHPEMSQMCDVNEKLMDETDEYIGKLITRLLADDCPAEAKAAFSASSSRAMGEAFNLVGRVAMEELMVHKDVGDALSSFERYLDEARIDALQ